MSNANILMVFEIIITTQCYSFVVDTLSYVLGDDRDFPFVYYNFADGGGWNDVNGSTLSRQQSIICQPPPGGDAKSNFQEIQTQRKEK